MEPGTGTGPGFPMFNMVFTEKQTYGIFARLANFKKKILTQVSFSKPNT
jgi:hypothetical protein